MAKLDGLKLTQSEVSQTIDLGEVFGVPLTGNESLKQVIGQALIDKIISRTESGKDVNGKPFKKYSKEYIESDEFKAFDKSPGEINMTLTGQMLGTLDVLQTAGSKVKIGWADDTENAKAYNHNVGDTIKNKRAFFGVTKADLNEIKKEFKADVEASVGKLQNEKDAIRAAILKRLTPGLFGVNNG